jgi:hypothetical protein
MQFFLFFFKKNWINPPKRDIYIGEPPAKTQGGPAKGPGRREGICCPAYFLDMEKRLLSE